MIQLILVLILINYWVQYLSNGRFKNADHQAVVNSRSSRLSIATFQNPAPNAEVFPLKIKEGEKALMEEGITFSEMYRRKMSNDLDLARIKKLATQKKLLEDDQEEPRVENSKDLQHILA